MVDGGRCVSRKVVLWCRVEVAMRVVLYMLLQVVEG